MCVVALHQTLKRTTHLILLTLESQRHSHSTVLKILCTHAFSLTHALTYCALVALLPYSVSEQPELSVMHKAGRKQSEVNVHAF